MSYLNKLESEEVDILMEHQDGLKCWQTDYKILNAHRNEKALANFNEEKAFKISYMPNQKPLFPEL